MLSQVRAGPAWRSWTLLIISGGGALLSFISSGILLLVGGVSLLNVPEASVNAQMMFNLAWVMLFVGLLCLPAAVYAIFELRGKPVSGKSSRKLFLAASAGMLLWTLVVIFFEPVETSELAWLFLPPLVLLVAVLPLWWYVETGRRGFLPDSPAQTWGIASFSLVITLPVILTFELLLFGLLVVAGGVYLGMQPDFNQQLSLLERMTQDPNLDPQIFTDLIVGFLQKPGVIFGVLGVTAGIIPLLEELLKPLALWLFAVDRLTPREGFLAGMLSGACFALWENLTAISAAGDGSGTEILIARVGTGLLHIITTGMVGWGMTSFWQSRGYLWRMIGTYLLAVALHGLWNANSIISGYAPILQLPAESVQWAQFIETGAIGILVTLIIVNFGLLLYANARLRKSQLVETVVPALTVLPLRSDLTAGAPGAGSVNTIEGDRENNSGDPHGVD